MSNWIEFKTGVQPVPDGVKVTIKTVDGQIETGIAERFFWDLAGYDSDIAAFKVEEKDMNNQDKPAFPSHGSMGEIAWEGLTAREYAAIKLRVPDSGTDWLDAMIKKSLLNEFAANASEQDIENHKGNGRIQEYVEVFDPGRKEIRHRRVFESREIAKYHYAQAMLKASKGE